MEHAGKEKTNFYFDPVGNPAHFRTLGQITLHKARLEDPRWVAYVQHYANAGIPLWNATTVAQEKIKRIKDGRQRFEHEIGIHQPDHPLYAAAKSRRINPHVPPSPALLIQNVQVLEEITGDGISTIQKSYALLGRQPDSIRRSFHMVERAATILGWQGDSRELVQENPPLLLSSMATIALTARLMAQFGSADWREASAQHIGRLTKRDTYWRLYAMTQGKPYYLNHYSRLEHDLKRISSKQVRRCIHEALTDDDMVAKLGQGVVRAYLRQYPLPEDILQTHPHLYRYMPRKHLPQIEIEAATKPALSGDEIWLSLIPQPERIPQRRYWLKVLNKNIQLGSRNLPKNQDEAQADRIIEARNAVYRTFGWAKPRNRQYPKYLQYVESRGVIAKPSRIVDICNVLEAHGVYNGLEIVGSCFTILRLSLERVSYTLQELKAAGLDPRLILARYPSIMCDSKVKLARTIHSIRRTQDRKS